MSLSLWSQILLFLFFVLVLKKLIFFLENLLKKKELTCHKCYKNYFFDNKLINQLKKMNCLIIAIKDAEEILDNAKLSVTSFKNYEEVRIPYRLLLARMNCHLQLKLENETINFKFNLNEKANG